ncbi:hypothetical protein AC1031_007133 [Aphanomyces cochlioides]|nr:hypothetical protein AC1031_007133 [Aphanomyces cochlioides]
MEFHAYSKRIQAVYRGWRVRRQLVDQVRAEYEQILQEVEREEFFHLLLHIEPTTVEWKGRTLCCPTFVRGFAVNFHTDEVKIPDTPTAVTGQKKEESEGFVERSPNVEERANTEPAVEKIEEDTALQETTPEEGHQDGQVLQTTEITTEDKREEEVQLDCTNIAGPSDPIFPHVPSLAGAVESIEDSAVVNPNEPVAASHPPNSPLDATPLDECSVQLQLLLQMTPDKIKQEIQWARRALRERRQFLLQTRK